MIKILYVEDDKGNLAMLAERLGRRGYEIVGAVDGHQAIDLARSEDPALILMDLDLPGIDGWEATRHLKAAEATRAIPVIAVSAHAMPGDRELAIAAGCDEYEIKPVDLQSLLQKIGSLLDGIRKDN
jgi:two-component system cell cycle response regulator DivK